MPTEEMLTSPRLLALQRDLAVGNSDTLAAFWQGVSQHGTPLIEPIAGEDGYSWVTFVCQAPADSRDVGVLSPLGGKGPLSEPMTCLPGTDLWHKSYRARNDLRTHYELALAGVEQPDPLNPASLFFSASDTESFFDKDTTTSLLELPAAPPQLWISPRPGIARGQLEQHLLRSDILENERRIWVYTPAGYAREDAPYPLLVLFDRWAYAENIPTPVILDNMIATGALPPLVAVMISSINVETRTLELPCNPAFADFLAQELIPWVRKHYPVTADPAQTIVGGASFGGLAAAYAGLRCPEIFGKVLCQSGSFWWKPEGDTEAEWLARQFARSPRLPLSFYLDVGLLETRADGGERPSQLIASRHMRDVLQARGYTVHYAEYNGAHNFVCWQGSLSEGLLALSGK